MLGYFAADEVGQGQIAGKGFSCEAAHDNFFVCGGHGSGGLSHVGMGSARKRSGRVVNSLTLCYIHILCLALPIFLNG